MTESGIDTAVSTLRRWRESPLAFVRENFQVEPDSWQRDALESFAHRQRLALRAAKGPGKTTVLAWLLWNFLATRPNANVQSTVRPSPPIAPAVTSPGVGR